MGHYCWICGRMRPNEKFLGSGHKRRVCLECAALPREERERIEALWNTTGYLRQRNISSKNMAHLQHLCESPDDEVRQTAALVLEVARVRPGKRKRTGWLSRYRPDLLARLVQRGLLDGLVDDRDCVAEADEETGTDSADCEVPF